MHPEAAAPSPEGLISPRSPSEDKKEEFFCEKVIDEEFGSNGEDEHLGRGNMLSKSGGLGYEGI